jgi:hypothetical protein
MDRLNASAWQKASVCGQTDAFGLASSLEAKPFYFFAALGSDRDEASSR